MNKLASITTLTRIEDNQAGSDRNDQIYDMLLPSGMLSCLYYTEYSFTAAPLSLLRFMSSPPSVSCFMQINLP
jgi:hypothetical protein